MNALSTSSSTKHLRISSILAIAAIFLPSLVVGSASPRNSAQNEYWSEHGERSSIATDKAVARLSFPQDFMLFDLDIDPLRRELFSVTDNQDRHSTVILLPNADGGVEEFEVVESSNFEPELQARFPEIRAFSGKGITDEYSTLKLSISPQGIQTMVFRADGKMECMEPYSEDHTVYAVFRSQRKIGALPWTCSTEDKNLASDIDSQISNIYLPVSSAGQLKTMRLAQSCNAEYSNWFGATSSAQVGLVLAAFNATLTRCNGVYEKDLALHLNLIANTTSVIYYNPATDPYTTMANWNSQLQATLNANIGAANYDIGHMFGASGGGGNAGCIGCVCNDTNKGSGITSPADGIPQGDNFDIDYVVHEVGHQLGANHTFSFSNEGTGVNKEIGSGITIMGYAGITAYDVDDHSIPIFHQASIAQIQTNLAGKSCPITTNISANNATPTANAGPNYTIPISTPFALIGSATDVDGDPLTYCWEQNDNTTTTGANSNASATKATGPNWLSFMPSTSPTRYCPQLSTILAGNLTTPRLPGGDAGMLIEALSSVSRTLNFRLTVRDNAPFSGTNPIQVGQTQFDDMTVTVSNTSGPFAVTAPNTAVSWTCGPQTVTWNVANTTTAPVSCANVQILLSTDGGITFPTVLIASTPNDGTESVTIPNSPTATARIKVAAVGNIFFDIGNANFTITCGGCTAPGAPTLSSATGACAGVNLTWTAGTGTTIAYNVYRAAGACGGAYAKIAGPIAGTSYSDTSAVAGTSYAYVVRGTCDAGGATESGNSNCLTATRLATPAAPTAVTATAGCTGNSISWTNAPTATSHNVIRGTVCGTALTTFTSVTSPYNDTTAVAGTTYNYWVVAVNACGNSANSTCATATRLAIPASPAAPTFTSVGCADLTVNWTAVSGAASYDVFRKAGANCGGATKINAAPVSGTSYPDSGLTANTQYAYFIVAVNACGTSADGSCAPVTTTGTPAAPSGLTATGTCTAVDLSWTAASGATSYEVWRTTNANCTSAAALLASPAGTTYNDTSAVAGTTYYYTVKGVNSCGTSAASTCTNAARLAAPAAPTGVNATGSCTEVSVSWTGNAQANSYNVIRGTVCGTAVTTFTNVTSPYSDTSAVAGTAYQYWVVAVNACGTSADSACAAGTRLVTPTPTITGASANTCPALTVPLTTEAGMSGYQWYLGGTPIGGATTNAYTATASGSYTVSYTSGGCPGTSAAKVVTISACVPNIVYNATGANAQVAGMGNDDTVLDPGESWDVPVTLINAGNSPATNIQASLSAAGATFCVGTASYGALAPAATSTQTFRFTIDAGFVCGDSLSFNVVNKTSGEGGYADENAAFTQQVGTTGAAVPEVGTTPNFTPPQNATTTRTLSPAFATPGAAAVSAVATYTPTAQFAKVTASLLRHMGSGNTVSLGTPTGNNVPLTVDVTAFYQANGPGTYEMEWTVGNKDVPLTNISLSVTPSSSPLCNTWAGANCLCSAPGAPSITGIIDVDPCSATGIQVTYTAGANATSHDLYRDGASVVTGYLSGATYVPGDTASHSYTVRAFTACGNTDSGAQIATDADNTPDAPVVTGITDVNSCVADGIQVAYTSGFGATSHDLYQDGISVVTGYISGATYVPGDTSSHNFVIRAVNGSCATDSTPMAGADAVCALPTETAPGTGGVSTAQTWTDKQTQTWPSVAGATSYTLYRGVQADLLNGNILNGNNDSCTRPSVGTTASNLTEDPSLDPLAVPGRFYWYIVTATNGAGEGPAGSATAGARTVNSTGPCP